MLNPAVRAMLEECIVRNGLIDFIILESAPLDGVCVPAHLYRQTRRHREGNAMPSSGADPRKIRFLGSLKRNGKAE